MTSRTKGLLALALLWSPTWLPPLIALALVAAGVKLPDSPPSTVCSRWGCSK